MDGIEKDCDCCASPIDGARRRVIEAAAGGKKRRARLTEVIITVSLYPKALRKGPNVLAFSGIVLSGGVALRRC
jgi:hypothetical protein